MFNYKTIKGDAIKILKKNERNQLEEDEAEQEEAEAEEEAVVEGAVEEAAKEAEQNENESLPSTCLRLLYAPIVPILVIYNIV